MATDIEQSDHTYEGYKSAKSVQMCKELENGLASGFDSSTFLKQFSGLSSEELQHTACDVVPVIFKSLNHNDDFDLSSTDTIQSAQQILNYFADKCEPKEFLVLVIEQARENWTAEKFVSLLPSVTRSLNRISPPRSQSLTFALKALQEFFHALPLPSTLSENLEENERLLLDLDESVRRICAVIPVFLDFAEPFVDGICRRIAESGIVGLEKEVTAFTDTLLSILNRPLGRLDLINRKNKSHIRSLAEACVSFIARFHPDFVKLVTVEQANVPENAKVDADKNVSEHEMVPPKLATFVFLAFGDRVEPDGVPCVYSHGFLLEFCAPYATLLLEDREIIPNLHGVRLCLRLLRGIEPETLPIDVIELDALRNLVTGVVKLTAAEKTKELNVGLLKILSIISRSLELPARAQFLYLMLKISPRSGGVISHIIGNISGEILANLDRRSVEGLNYFAGPDLERLLHLVFALPSGEKTDLLANSERIMAALKLLGIILQKDKISTNASGIWDIIPLIEKNYLKLLRSAVDLSRSHYELEIKNTRERCRGNATVAGKGDAEVALPKRQQLGVLEMAVHTFDMMESVVVSVANIIETQRKENTAVAN